MASDSDLDEDELLQMALKEQSERNINYHKQSKPSKPVVNLVQTPPPPPFILKSNSTAMPDSRARSNSKGKRRNSKGGAYDEDDSEVELLSISSGDEESIRDLGVSQKVRPPRRGSIDDDRVDDGGEPRSWKRVNESELARRVRELRETRSTPQTIDTKPIGRKGLANLQSLPRGVEVLDPLGLGVIDNTSLRLIIDGLEEKPEPVDLKTREKMMYTSPNFDPKLFLTRVHQETSAADLESGALTLKSDLKGWTQQKKQLVKENFDCFVSCKTTIDDIESKLRQIEEDPEGSGTSRLYESTHRITELANGAFQPLFERQVQAEKIRSVQGMLQRFRTLFNLPSLIQGSVSKGEYDLAVREYRKAKSIVLPSHVGILKRVLEEVERVMCEFKSMLYKSMEESQLDLAELEKTVRLLLELEPDSDPVWHYLNIQNHRVRGLFEKCTIDYESQMELLHNEIQERVQSDARWRQIQQESNKSLGVDAPNWDSLAVDSQQLYMSGEEVDALRGRYISRLTAVLIHHIPAFWRLALSVFSGKFVKGTAGNVHFDSDSNAKHAQSRSEEKATDVKFSSHSLEEVATMVHGTINAYEAKVLNTFREFEESNILKTYMSDSIKEIAKACLALEGKEFCPSIAVKTLRALHFEITKVHVFRLCSWMRVASEEIAKEEMWIPLSTLQRNKSPYSISYLPIAFREMTSSAMDRIQIMIQNLTTETTKSDDMLDQIQEIRDSVRIGFLNCFLDFAGYLERIGTELSQTNSNKEEYHFQKDFLYGFEGELHGFCSGGVVADSHKRLLIVLSNIGYCKDELVRELYAKYMHIWMPYRERNEQNNDVHDLVSSFSALEDKVLENYTYAKSNLIRTAALNYLLDSGIQWGSAPSVKGVRDATIELIHCLVAVYAEVFSGAKPLLEKTMGILVEGLIDTFISLSHENRAKHLKSLDMNGFCQLMLELEYIETVLHSYFSSAAHESLKSLQGLLLEKGCEGTSESADNPGGHHRRPTKGSEEAISDDRQQASAVSPDDLIALAQQYSSELLEGELERTRLNISCFMEASLRPNSVPATLQKSSSAAYSGFQKPVSSPHYRRQQTVSSPSFSRHRRR